MNVLVVAPQPFMAPRGTPFSVYYRALVMAEQGAQVDILAYGAGQEVDVAGVRVWRIPRVRLLEPVPVGPSWQKALLDVLMVLYTIGLLVRRRYDAVDAHEEAVFWCRFLKPVFRFKLVYDMHSSLPQQLANFRFTKSRLLTGIFRWLEATSLGAADVVVTVCPALHDYVTAAGVPPPRCLLVENSIFDDVRLRHPLARDAAGSVERPAPFPPDSRVVLYAGTFEAYQGVELLVGAFARAVARVPDARLLLVGGSDEQVQRMRRLVEAKGLSDKCKLTGQVPKDVAARLIQRASVLVSPRLHGMNTPLKIYEQLASGRPLVATRIDAHTQVLDDSVCWLVAPDAESFGAALTAALTDDAEAAARSRNAAELYRRQYSRPVYEGKIRQLLEFAG